MKTLSQFRQSFTLVELLIVLIIIGIIATLAVPQFQVMAYNARGAEVKSNMGAIVRAMAAFYAEKGELPCTYTGSYMPLEFLIKIPSSKYWRYLYMTLESTPPPTVAGLLAIPVNATPDEVVQLITSAPYTNSEGAPQGAIVAYWLYLRWDTQTPPANEEFGGLAFDKYYKFYKKKVMTGSTTVSKAGW